MNMTLSLGRVAAAARNIRRASSSVATLTRVVRTIEHLRMELGPGSFLSGLVELTNGHLNDARKMEAARHLARRYVTRRAVFHPNRWSLLENEFNRRRDGRHPLVAWVELTAPAILLAFEAIPGDTPLNEVWRALRRRVRAEIEWDLVCRTLDSKTEGPIAGDAEAVAPQELMRAVDLRLDDLAALQGLEQAERYLLTEYYSIGNADRNALAKRLGISGVLLRKWVQRARDRLRKFSA